MKTAMQQLIDWINSDYRTQIEVEVKANEFLELEKQQIMEAFKHGISTNINEITPEEFYYKWHKY